MRFVGAANEGVNEGKGGSVVEQRAGDQPASGRPGLKASRAEAKVEEWVTRSGEATAKLAAHVLMDRDAAEDVVQRVFMMVLSEARSDPDAIERIRNPRAWLLETTRNVALGVLKTKARRRRLRRQNGDRIRESLFPEPDAGSGRDPRAERVLEAAPSVLTKRQHEVFCLRMEAREDAEITREPGMKPGTVRWHWAEAIRRLREYHPARAAGGDQRVEPCESYCGRDEPGMHDYDPDAWHYLCQMRRRRRWLLGRSLLLTG